MKARRDGLPLALLLALLALALAGCGSDGAAPSNGPAPREQAAELRLLETTVASEAVGRRLTVSTIVPPGPTAKRGLLVFLHGAGGSNTSFLADGAMRDGLLALGKEAPVVAFPEGGESWWHDRADGDWGRYVVGEAIPAVVRRLGLDPRRVAIGGISMGGFGAYHLGLAYPGRFCAVGGHSAGLWLDPADEYTGAFDGPADFRRNGVVARVQADPNAYGPTPVWNDYGDRDWFVPGNAAFVAALEEGDTPLTAHVWPGGHDGAYWNAHMPQYLRFYARSLSHC